MFLALEIYTKKENGNKISHIRDSRCIAAFLLLLCLL